METRKPRIVLGMSTAIAKSTFDMSGNDVQIFL